MTTTKKFLDEISIEKIQEDKLDGISYQDVRRKNRRGSVHHSTSFFIAKNFLLTSAHNVTKLPLQNVNKITIYPSRIADNYHRGSISIDVKYKKNIRIATEYSFRKKKSHIPHDIALIYIPDSIIDSNEKLKTLPFLPIFEDVPSLKEGETIYCGGYPASGEYKGEYKMTLDTSSITNIYKYYFKHSLDTRTGNSGSPIMIKRDGIFYVIGINSIKNNGTLINTVKNDKIKKWMKELKR